jgi:hypothetical protein
MDIISDRVEPPAAQAALDAGAKNAANEAKLTQAARWRPPVVATAPQVLPSRNPSLPTFAGLMTLFLTFFIVLTSMSLHDKTKSDKAIASVQQAFGNAVPVEESEQRWDEDILRDYVAGLTHRIQSLVPLMGGKPAPASDHQVLWLPAELAFPGQDAALARVFPTVLREVVNSLDGIPQRLTPRIEMRLCARETSERLRDRAVAIGAALARERAPLAQFSVGIQPCDPAYIGIAVALAPASDEALQ